jgi:hypothetical protein
MKTRQEYETAQGIVRSVISKWDPYSLIGGGAPGDEFDDEVARILTRIREMRSPKDAAAAISAVFSTSFDPKSFSVPACAEVGMRLYSRLVNAGVLKHDV